MSTTNENNSVPESAAVTTVSRTLRMPESLLKLVKDTGKEVGLAEADVMRLGLERGIELLRAQLTSRPLRARRIAGVDTQRPDTGRAW